MIVDRSDSSWNRLLIGRVCNSFRGAVMHIGVRIKSLAKKFLYFLLNYVTPGNHVFIASSDFDYDYCLFVIMIIVSISFGI